jgi:hypothetical protein
MLAEYIFRNTAHTMATKKKSAHMSQQELLRDAMDRLGMTRDQFAARINASRRRLDNWLLPDGSAGLRELDSVVCAFVREIVEREGAKKD